jgi:uncharacterized coiled-coil DUF342 family protein
VNAIDELRNERDRIQARIEELDKAIDELSPNSGPCISTYREFMDETVGFEWLVGGF